MKANLPLLISVLSLMALAMVAGCAHESNSAQTYNNLTGSYIPQDVQRNGPVTNGKSNVRVLDRSDIETSGGADVHQSLQQLGVH